MNKSKLNSLLAWVNSTGAGPCLESLEQLQNGEHFIELIRRRNGDGNGISYCDTSVRHKFRHISAFVTDFYNIKSGMVPFNYDDILNRCQIEEIGKLTALLMCSCFMGTNNEQFVVDIEKLDASVQRNIMEIIQHIVLKDDNDDISLADNFVDILYKGAPTQIRAKTDSMSQLRLKFISPGLVYRGSDLSEMTVNTPDLSSVSSMSSVFTFTPGKTPNHAVTPMSPMRAFISSPQVKQKIMARKRYETYKNIQSQLAMERALGMDLEAQLKEKDGIISNHKAQLKDKEHEVQRLKKALVEYESSGQDELHKQVKINETLRQSKLQDMDLYKKDKATLQEVIERLNNEMLQLQSQVSGQQTLILRNQDLEKRLRDQEALNFKLNTEVGRTKEMLVVAEEKINTNNVRYEEMETIFKSRLEALQEQLAKYQSENIHTLNLNQSGGGESLAVVSDIKIFELQEHIQRLQNELESSKSHNAEMMNKMMSAVKEREIAIQELERKVQGKDQELVGQIHEKEKLTEEKLALEGALELSNLERKNLERESENLKQEVQGKVGEIELIRQEHIKSSEAKEAEMNKMMSEQKDRLKACIKDLEESKVAEISQLTQEIERIRAEAEKRNAEKNREVLACTAKIADLKAFMKERELVIQEMHRTLESKDRELFLQVQEKEKVNESKLVLEGVLEFTNLAMKDLEKESESLKKEVQSKVNEIERIGKEHVKINETKQAEMNKMMSEQKDRLEACIKDLEESKVAEISRLTLEIERVGREADTVIAQKTQEILSCTAKMEKMMSAVKEREIAIQELEEKVQGKDEELVGQIQEKEKLMEEKLALEKQLEAFTQEISKLQRESESLKQQLTDQVGEIELIQQENVKSSEAKMAEMNKMMSEHAERVSRLEREKASLKQEVDNKVSEMELIRQENITNGETKLVEMSKIISEHAERVNMLERENDSLKRDVGSKVSEMELIQQENTKNETKVAEMEKILSEQKKEMEASVAKLEESKVAEISRLSLEIERVRTEADKLIAEKTQEISACIGESEKMMAAMKEREMAIEDLEKKMQGKEEELVRQMQEKERLTDEKLALERQLQAFTQEISKLQRESESLKQQVTDKVGEIELIRQQNDSLKQEIGSKVSELELRQEQNTKNSETEMAEMKKIASKQKEQLETLDSKVTEISRHNQELERLRAEADIQIAQKTQEILSCTAKMEKLMVAVKEREDTIQELEEIVQGKDEELVGHIQEKEKLTEEKLALERQLETFTQETKKLERESESLKREVQNKVCEVELIRQEHTKSSDTKMAEMNRIMSEHAEMMKKLEREKDSLKQVVQEKVSEIELIRQENIKSCETKNAEMSKIMSEHAEMVNRLERENESLKQDIQNKGSEIEVIRQENVKSSETKVEEMSKIMSEQKERLETRIAELEESKIAEISRLTLEVETLQAEANKWITEKNREVSACTANSEKMMVAVKEQKRAIQELQTEVRGKDQELVSRVQEKEKLTEEKLALERQLEAFNQEMSVIQGKLIAMSKQQKERAELEGITTKLKRDKGALEAKIQRLLTKSKDDHTKMGKLEKYVNDMEREVKLMNQVRDEAVSKADDTRKENEQMRIEIRTLQSKLTLTEEELREEKSKNFQNFSAVEHVQSMDSIVNDSLEGDLSPDDLNVSQASNASSKSGFSIGLPLGNKLTVTLNRSEKKKSSRSNSRARTASSTTPTNTTPSELQPTDSFMSSQMSLNDSFSSFQQPSFSSASTSRRLSLRSASRSTRRESILPPRVDDTIDELAKSKPSFLRNSALQHSMRSSRQTTARSGFVVVNDCEDEPDQHFDWNRLAELKRRNTLCLPHERTSYPVEVQMRPTNEMTENELQKGTNELSSPGALTRSRKRRSMEQQDHSIATKVRTGNQRQQMPAPELPPPKLPPPRSRKQQTTTNTSTFVPSTSPLPSSPDKEEYNRRESVMFSVGFTPKQRKGKAKKASRRKPLTPKNSTEKNKSGKWKSFFAGK